MTRYYTSTKKDVAKAGGLIATFFVGYLFFIAIIVAVVALTIKAVI